MNAPFQQSTRMGALSTVLGADVLALLRLSAEEHVNDLFVYRVEALSTQDNIDFDTLVGTHATVSLKSFSHPDVPFDGIVTEAAFVGLHENGWRYELTLRPWFWLAGRRRNQRIYHNKTVVEILDELLAPYGALGQPAMEKRLSGTYPPLEYTVQYRESDLEFATRLMERFGISYYFEHGPGNHTLVLTDAMTAHDALPGGSRKFLISPDNHRANEEHFWAMAPSRRITTGAVRLTDYNFKTPKVAMEVDRSGDAAYAEGQIESYDYPGVYPDAGQGRNVAGLRVAQERGQDHRHRAVGDVTSLRAGLTVAVKGDKVAGINDPCLCLTARHTYTTEGYASGQGSDDATYEGAYVLLPTTAPLAPERKTRVPVVQGPQTARVVGEDEVDCDEYGRILVHFHWDLDDRYSMRCRVSQNWAGSGWGGMVIPRVGMEVVVEFLEGDPDKPLVTGCVYNGRNAPPAALPDHKSRSVFKTKSHKGEGFNELTFEDKAGDEFIYMHAQKNLDLHVKNSRQKRVEFDDNATIGNNSTLAVAANRTENIDGAMDMTVKGALSEKIDGDRGITVGGGFATTAGGNLTLKSDGEIILDASKITLVSGGAAVVVQGGAVNVAPVLNVGSASPGAAAIPAIPAVLKAAAGEGSPFVSHCPNAKDE